MEKSNSEPEKIRNVPHFKGNFSSLISLKIPGTSKKLNNFTCQVKRILEFHSNNKTGSKILYKEINPYEDSNNHFHISMSRNFYLKYHQIEKLLSKLEKEFKSFNKKLTLILSSQVKYFNNEYNNRNFLTIEIIPNLILKRVINIIKNVLNEFGLETFCFNEDFIPHISIIWTDTSFSQIIPQEILNDKIRNDKEIKNILKNKGYLKILSFEEFYVTVGSRTVKIKLK